GGRSRGATGWGFQAPPPSERRCPSSSPSRRRAAVRAGAARSLGRGHHPRARRTRGSRRRGSRRGRAGEPPPPWLRGSCPARGRVERTLAPLPGVPRSPDRRVPARRRPVAAPSGGRGPKRRERRRGRRAPADPRPPPSGASVRASWGSAASAFTCRSDRGGSRPLVHRAFTWSPVCGHLACLGSHPKLQRGGDGGMKIHRFARSAVIAAAAVTLVAAACSNTSSTSSSSGSTSGGFQGTALNGAGSTFAQPLYQLWSQSFLQKEPDAQINYQPIGSGGGIEQFTAETVDFGATDVPLQSDEIGNLPNQNY